MQFQILSYSFDPVTTNPSCSGCTLLNDSLHGIPGWGSYFLANLYTQVIDQYAECTDHILCACTNANPGDCASGIHCGQVSCIGLFAPCIETVEVGNLSPIDDGVRALYIGSCNNHGCCLVSDIYCWDTFVTPNRLRRCRTVSSANVTDPCDSEAHTSQHPWTVDFPSAVVYWRSGCYPICGYFLN